MVSWPFKKNPAVDPKQPCDPGRVAFGKTCIMPLCKISGNNTCLSFPKMVMSLDTGDFSNLRCRFRSRQATATSRRHFCVWSHSWRHLVFLCLRPFGLSKILVITPKKQRQDCWCYIAKKSPNLRLTFEAPDVPYSSADYSHTGFGYSNCSCFGSCLACPSVHGLGSIVTRFRADVNGRSSGS